MCSYKILVHNKWGYIVKCNNCNHFQIAFGTTVISLKTELFQEFRLQIKELKQTTVYNGFPKQKYIPVKTHHEDVLMTLNYNELQRLFALIDEAMLANEMNQLLIQNKIEFRI